MMAAKILIEAVARWWQPHDVIMNITVPGIGEMKITSADLAAPVSMSFEHHKHCLFAVWRGLGAASPCRAGGLAPPEMFLGSAGKGRFFVPA